VREVRPELCIFGSGVAHNLSNEVRQKNTIASSVGCRRERGALVLYLPLPVLFSKQKTRRGERCMWCLRYDFKFKQGLKVVGEVQMMWVGF
jgi:hypothetical protein